MENNCVKIAYVPVVHRGYLEFFNGRGGRNFILPHTMVEGFGHLDRDVRALSPEEIVCELSLAHKISCEILTKESLSELLRENALFVLPNDDIGHALSEQCLVDAKCEFVNTFLRWDKMASFSKGIPEGTNIIQLKDLDEDMRESVGRAQKIQERSSDWWRQVGCYFVARDGTTIAAHNKHLPHEYVPYIDGDPRGNFEPGEFIEISTALHGELGVVVEAARRGISMQGGVIRITTFPCAGCAGALSKTGIKKLYFLSGYSNLNGERSLRDAEIDIIRVVE